MFFGFAPGSKRINSDVARIRKKADLRLSELVPWSQEDVELFSFNQKGIVKKRLGRSYEGVICSIFHESMVFYHFKKYRVSKTNAILYIRTARYEFVYRIRAEEAQVFVNNDYLASLTKDGILYNKSEKGRKRGQVIDTERSRKVILLDNRVVGHITFPEDRAAVNPRAFAIDVKLTEADLIHFMVLGIHEVVRFLIPSRKRTN